MHLYSVTEGAQFQPMVDQDMEQQHNMDLTTVPPIQFQVLLSLFAESFSPFHHCTFLLSVSLTYLALAEIYLPLRTSFPKNPTQ